MMKRTVVAFTYANFEDSMRAVASDPLMRAAIQINTPASAKRTARALVHVKHIPVPPMQKLWLSDAIAHELGDKDLLKAMSCSTDRCRTPSDDEGHRNRTPLCKILLSFL